MTRLHVRVAADRVGVTRQTLFKYIRQGKISATIGHDGQKQIDVSELLRVFGELQEPPVNSGYSDDSRTLSSKTPVTPTTVALQMELERTKAALEFKTAELALIKERVEELKVRETQSAHREREIVEERNRLIGVIEQQNRLLAAPVPEAKAIVARRPAAKKVVVPPPEQAQSPSRGKKTPVEIEVNLNPRKKKASAKKAEVPKKIENSVKKASKKNTKK